MTVSAVALCAFAAPAKACSPAPPLDCGEANAETAECKVQAACGGLQVKLGSLGNLRWGLWSQLLQPGLSLVETAELEAKHRRATRKIERVSRRLNKFERRALRP